MEIFYWARQAESESGSMPSTLAVSARAHPQLASTFRPHVPLFTNKTPHPSNAVAQRVRAIGNPTGRATARTANQCSATVAVQQKAGNANE